MYVGGGQKEAMKCATVVKNDRRSAPVSVLTLLSFELNSSRSTLWSAYTPCKDRQRQIHRRRQRRRHIRRHRQRQRPGQIYREMSEGERGRKRREREGQRWTGTGDGEGEGSVRTYSQSIAERNNLTFELLNCDFVRLHESLFARS
jgi:hypothetical protein